MSVRIIIGDVRERLRDLPDESVHCIVTSPPYWGLRCYGVEGQLGLEPTLWEHLAVMVEVFRDVRRVLRRDGTLWLNYGDCYATGGGRVGNAPGGGKQGESWKLRGLMTPPNRMPQPGLKPKDLCMVANRLAIALQDDGWWVRSEIVWNKLNPMPESVCDRPTTSHEKLWLLTKSERYYYDAEAIMEPVTGGAHARARALGTDTGVGWGRLDRLDPDQPDRGRDRIKSPGRNSRENIDRIPRTRKVKVPGGWDVGPGAHGTINRQGRTSATYRDLPGVHPKSAGEDTNIKAKGSFGSSVTQLVERRNRRNVWSIATEPFSEAHFATFPPALIEPCILAGCPEGGTVLDPFGGAGTVGLVADRLKRNAILIELNPAYAAMAERRLHRDAGLFADVRAEPLQIAAE